MARLLLAVVVVLAVACVGARANPQPALTASDTPECAAVRTYNRYATWAQARACTRSVPLNTTQKAQTISALTGMITQLHVFTDLARKSPEPRFPVAVDILAELQTLSSTVQPDEYTLHQELLVAFNKLFDAHTPYIKPAVFGRYIWRLGVSLEYRVDANGNGDVYLYYLQPAATVAATYANLTGNALFPATSIDGWKVSRVNGVPAVPYFAHWASDPAQGNVGNVKDNGTLFEMALHGTDRNPILGNYVLRPGVVAAIAEETSNGTVTFTVTNGAQTVDWTTQFIALSLSSADAYAAATNSDAQTALASGAGDAYHSLLSRVRAAVEGNEVAAHAVPKRLRRRVALRARHTPLTGASQSMRDIELDGWHQPAPGVWAPKTEQQIATELGVPHHLLPLLDTDRADPMFGPPLVLSAVAPQPQPQPRPQRRVVQDTRALEAGRCAGVHVPVDQYTGVGYVDLNGDNSVGVLQVTTFHPDTLRSPAATQNFANQIADILSCAPAKLVVDLTGNGGGSIGLGYGLLKTLFPQITERDMEQFGATDWVRSALNVAFADRTMEMIAENPFNLTGLEVWAPWAWAPATAPYPDADDTVGGYRGFYNDSRWLTAGSTRVRNGVTSQWSQVVRDGGLMKSAYDIWVTPNAVPSWAPQDIAILSNGFCGSTCALFSTYVQFHGLAKSITLGGLATQNQQFWAFPGLQVFDLQTIGLISQFFGLQSLPAVPPQFPAGNGAVTQTCIREIFEWTDTTFDVPTEYRFVPSAYHLSYTTRLNDTLAIYRQLLPILNACDPNAQLDMRCVNRDSVVGGDGAQYCTGPAPQTTTPCQLQFCALRGYVPDAYDGKLPTQCITCDPGQYLSDPHGTCVPCPAGTFRAEHMSPLMCVPCTNAAAYSGGGTVSYSDATGGASADCPFSTSAPGGLSANGRLAITGIFCFVGGGLLIGGVMWYCLVRSKRGGSGESSSLAPSASSYDRMH